MLTGNQIIEAVRKSPRIPAPSQTVYRVLAMTREPNCDLSKVAEVIATDAGLTAQLLREINSALHAGTKATSSVLQACLRLGLKRVRASVINQHVVSALGKACPPGFDSRRYFLAALATSVAAQDLAKQIQPELAEDAATAGLLCDLGIGLLAYGVKELYRPVLEEYAKGDGAVLPQIEQRALGVTHCEVGAAVLADWGLDAHVLEAVKHHHRSPREADLHKLTLFPRVLAAAVTLSELAMEGSEMERVDRLFTQVETLTKGADAIVTKLLDTLVSHIQEAARNLAVELGDTKDVEANLAMLMQAALESPA